MHLRRKNRVYSKQFLWDCYRLAIPFSVLFALRSLIIPEAFWGVGVNSNHRNKVAKLVSSTRRPLTSPKLKSYPNAPPFRKHKSALEQKTARIRRHCGVPIKCRNVWHRNANSQRAKKKTPPQLSTPLNGNRGNCTGGENLVHQPLVTLAAARMEVNVSRQNAAANYTKNGTTTGAPALNVPSHSFLWIPPSTFPSLCPPLV